MGTLARATAAQADPSSMYADLNALGFWIGKQCSAHERDSDGSQARRKKSLPTW